ncbi:hypothetical protein Q0590_29985 [Rhodocytophaga aerolata]|uniref:VOC domain-containing protein n=1 Tax=Rhodocytophaga aerolata TaxID=455078 RepID=A0ABT8REZ1_9BACT|nr:hypothetical protein [Rhodocytophaga aerolata]MDO1450544.1 hypothetical protein [Rhodocytophaga aerolata]
METDKNTFDRHEKVITIVGCANIRAQVEFYKALGFEVVGIYTSSNPYACLRWKNIELHFYGSRKVVASENATCYLPVRDLDQVNHRFENGLKSYYGKIPRNGFPKVTKV